MDDDAYHKLEQGDSVDCFYDGCNGHLKRVKETKKLLISGRKKYYEISFICRCTRDCRHKIVLVKNELSSKVVSFSF